MTNEENTTKSEKSEVPAKKEQTKTKAEKKTPAPVAKTKMKTFLKF